MKSEWYYDVRVERVDAPPVISEQGYIKEVASSDFVACETVGDAFDAADAVLERVIERHFKGVPVRISIKLDNGSSTNQDGQID